MTTFGASITSLFSVIILKTRNEFYMNYRNGEWGDHVTLQAAADWVQFFSPYFLAYVFLHSSILPYLWQFGVKVFIITSFKDTCYIEILPQVQKSDRSMYYFCALIHILCLLYQTPFFTCLSRFNAAIFLSFWAEVHYNSIYPLGGKDSLVVLS